MARPPAYHVTLATPPRASAEVSLTRAWASEYLSWPLRGSGSGVVLIWEEVPGGRGGVCRWLAAHFMFRMGRGI